MTRKPIFSSTGTRRDSATGLPMMVDLQRRLLRLLVGMPVVVDGDRIVGVDRGDAARIGQRFRRRKAAAIAFREPRGDAGERRIRRRPRPPPRASASSQVRTMSRIAASIVRLLDLRRLAAGAADDEMHAGQPAFRKGRIVGRQAAFEDCLQIGADLLAHDAVVAVARDEDENGNETIELVDAHQRPDARPLDQAPGWPRRACAGSAPRSGTVRRADRTPAR